MSLSENTCPNTDVPCRINEIKLMEREEALVKDEIFRLTTWAYKLYFRRLAPRWEVLPTARGMCTQLDNMLAGLNRMLEAHKRAIKKHTLTILTERKRTKAAMDMYYAEVKRREEAELALSKLTRQD